MNCFVIFVHGFFLVFIFIIILDVLSNRKMLQLILKKKGYECDQCADGEDAVKAMTVKGLDYYHLILMDSVMPIMVSSLSLIIFL